MKVNAMILDIVNQNDRYSTVLLKEMDSTNEFACSIFSYMLDGIEIGNVYDIDLKFKIKHRVFEQTSGMYFQGAIIRSIKKGD